MFRSLATVSILCTILSAPALAQRGGTAGGPSASGHSGRSPAHTPGPGARPAPGLSGGPHQHLDSRFSHNRYYYDRGHPVHEPPRGGVQGLRPPNGGRYYSYGGNWYRWRGGWYRWWRGGWVVWSAPIGLLVPLLPPYYTTVWWRGIPYYYANDTYYLWDAGQGEYEVVAPPAGIDTGGSVQPPPSNELFAYPRNGQSEELQRKDRDDCQGWAAAQTGFDLSSPEGSVEKRNEYLRAQAACLEGRGYSVR